MAFVEQSDNKYQQSAWIFNIFVYKMSAFVRMPAEKSVSDACESSRNPQNHSSDVQRYLSAFFPEKSRPPVPLLEDSGLQPTGSK